MHNEREILLYNVQTYQFKESRAEVLHFPALLKQEKLAAGGRNRISVSMYVFYPPRTRPQLLCTSMRAHTWQTASALSIRAVLAA